MGSFRLVRWQRDMRIEDGLRSEQGIELVQFLRIVQRRWVSIVACMAVAVSLGLVYLHSAQPLYTSELLVSPTNREGSSTANRLSGIAGLAGLSLSAQSQPTFSAYMEGLHSRQLADLLAQDQALMRRIFATSWDEKRGQFVPPSGFRAQLVKVVKNLLGYPDTGWSAPGGAELHEFLKSRLTITSRDESGFLVLSIRTADPALGREILQKAHTTVDTYIRQQRAASSRAYVDYLSKRLEAVHIADYRQALVDVIAQQEKTLMFASDPNAYAAQAFGPPYSRRRPTSPQPILTLVATLVAGLIVGLGWALVRGTTSDPVNS